MRTRDTVHGMKRFGSYSRKEIINLLITALVFGFIFSFTKWGGETYSATTGILNLILFTIISLLALVVMFTGEKFMAIKFGMIPTYRMWGTGLGICTFLCFLTNGLPLFLASGGLDVKRNEVLQMGYFFKGIVFKRKAYMAFWGLFSLVLYSCILSILPISIGMKSDIIFTTLMIGAWSLIPIDAIFAIWNKNVPNSNGTNLFFGQKGFLVFALAFYALSWLLITYTGFWTILIATILAAITGVVWVLFLSPKKLWNK